LGSNWGNEREPGLEYPVCLLVVAAWGEGRGILFLSLDISFEGEELYPKNEYEWI